MLTDISSIDSGLESFIEEQAPGTFAHTQAWLQLISRLYGYKVDILTASRDGKIAGFLPLCSMQSPLTGRRLVALPFSDICPLLATDDASANELIDTALALAKERNVKYLELRTGSNEVLAKRKDLSEENLYVRWSLPLVSDANTIWSKLHKHMRNLVKKSQKLGVQIRIAQKREDMAHYYALHLLTRSKKHGMPAQPQRYFYGLWDTFAAKGEVQLLLAEYEGKVIAGVILLASGTTIHYAYSASDEHYLNKLEPSKLLLWKAIELGCTLGYQTFDMGRTAHDNEGLMDFKRRWGATQEALPYYYYPKVDGLASTSESSRKFQLLTSVWRRLPLSVAGPLGGYLYKHLG